MTNVPWSGIKVIRRDFKMENNDMSEIINKISSIMNNSSSSSKEGNSSSSISPETVS